MHFSEVTKSGSVIMPKLVKHVKPSSTLAEELSLFFARSAAPSSVRLRVLVSGSTSASVAKRDYAELHAAVLLDAGLSLSSPP